MTLGGEGGGYGVDLCVFVPITGVLVSAKLFRILVIRVVQSFECPHPWVFCYGAFVVIAKLTLGRLVFATRSVLVYRRLAVP